MSIVLERLLQRYGEHTVVNNVSLEIGDGELFVLLGPSGSGKSTVLRMIAGLVEIEQGSVRLHGRDVTHLPPQRRGVGLVFQHYALFRHMTAAENIEFALRIRRVAREERERRRDELLDLVGLVGLGGRTPRQLSGRQQQRVALARALAHRPEVLLLDEPFGALDARIRSELRRTVRAIQRELGIATIFVTHDQEEAFEIGDRIGVMNFGRLLEVGPPRELYLRPQTEFVATFLGTANLLVGRCTPTGVRIGEVEFPLSTTSEGASDGLRVQVLFRPEDVAVKTSPAALSWPLLGEAEVEETSFSGSYERLRLRLPRLEGVRSIAPPAPFGGDSVVIEARRPQDQARRFALHPGQKAWVGVRRFHALTHPGLSFLLATDGSPAAEAALRFGVEVAKLAHARVTLLGCGTREESSRDRIQRAKEEMGAGLAGIDAIATNDPMPAALGRESERQHFDLVLTGAAPGTGAAVAAATLQNGDHHVLIVPRPASLPTHALICVAIGEPGKADVLFTARLIRHLGAEATVFSVLVPADESRARAPAERFLAASARTLSRMGVPARTLLRTGEPRVQVMEEIKRGGYDLIVLGTPLPDHRGRIDLGGLTGDLLNSIHDRPVLVVRSGALTA